MNSARSVPNGDSVRTMLRGELAPFFVLQRGTALRPLTDRSETCRPPEKRFFLSHWFDCINKPGSNPTR